MEWTDGLLSATIRNYVYLNTTKYSKKDSDPEPKSKISDSANVFKLDSSDTADTDYYIFEEMEKDIKIAESQDFDWQWIILDGPVDTLWVENLNSVLDDTRTLCLANSERIALTNKIRVIFEVDSLSQASPATVGRCAMVYMDPVDLGWEPYVKSWLLKISKIMNKSEVDCLEFMIKNSITDGLRFIKKHQKFQPFPVQDITIVTTLCRILDAFFEFMDKNGGLGQREDSKDISAEETSSQCSKVSVKFKDIEKRAENTWYLEKNPVKVRKTIQKLFVFAFTWAFGGALKREDEHEDDVILYSSSESDSPARVTYDFDNLIRELFENNSQLGNLKQNISILLSETNKTATGSLDKITKKPAVKTDESSFKNNNKGIIISSINFNISTTAAKAKEMILKKLIVAFIDDLNIPESDMYGAQPPLELIRQLLDLGGIYDTEKIAWKNIQDLSVVAACVSPVGRRTISPRLLRHFSILVLPHLPQSALHTIFQLLLGLLQADKFVINSKEMAALFFVHEATRVFHDRLIEQTEKGLFYQFLSKEIENYFQVVLYI
ncbi:Dynein heavy chain 14; axonemal [Camelus dromedarius]|uniref:Dynein heavy chain 14 n=1 Tax=Camelus dromedarius TaxID=9838 RepID=A0A5N4CII4_CAMDR|nr:Dynein heavy chain 14; axonemal [Camelus dromedarius]